MNFLAQILPAIREVRAPLIGGYLWLTFAWLALEDRIPSEAELSAGSTWARLWRLDEVVGNVGVVVLLSISAYIVGSLVGEPIEFVANRFTTIRSEALEQAHAVVPESRYLIEQPMRLFAEADLRFHIALPLMLTASVVDRPGWIVCAAGSALIGLHGALLLGRADRLWLPASEQVESRVELRTEGLSGPETAALTISHEEGQDQRGGRADFLVLRNEGPGVATDIWIENVDEDLRNLLVPDTFPIPELRANDRLRLRLMLVLNTPPHVQFRVKWTDASGERMQVYSVTLFG